MNLPFLPYGRQNISQDDIDSVIRVLKSDYLTQGPITGEFEKEASLKVSCKYVVSVNSGTSALHIACLALDLNPGDILWTTPITFVASANCARYCGAEIDFVDIDPKTGLMSTDELEKKLKEAEKQDQLPKIVIPVHLAGTSCDMQTIYKLSKEYGFSIIEDASHAIGGFYKEYPVGSCKFSNITVFSLHPVKIITSAEGGLATTNDSLLAKKLRLLSSHGIVKNKNDFINKKANSWFYEQQLLGFNYRMTDVLAALGLSQLKRLDYFISERQSIFKSYKNIFSDLPLYFLEVPDNIKSSHHLAIIRLNNKNQEYHRKVFDGMRSKNIGVQLHYTPVHLQPYYKEYGFRNGLFPKAEQYSSNAMSLPIFPGLSDNELKRIYNDLSSLL
ncbi:UDP-4-amino-4,6-dideoxy-N-acetyl-beta-L-altrosamine transaminase [Prochlorococcus marinus]|uniref:UDP-4-amino-4, 6-dideoxy-N-acetyl-beta-L-altrosamine transaminase n=1 Tax=Prochlorococcus marinus TaxID=1219 RepID=UPI0022B401EB|nr:UDP-4-amino-4,6-dideoxy-N-acetyl-beta-L-altrosamine transaminase [Prochlorococcus marinus]